MLTPSDPLAWINYAVPIANGGPTGIEEMIAVFQQSDRAPRLEFFIDLWPEVAYGLEAKGFVCEKRMPIMVLPRENWKGFTHSHDVQEISAETFHPLGKVLAEAFGMPASEEELSDPHEDPSFNRLISRINLATVALVDGQVVGGGYAIGTKEIREIAGIGTATAHRRKGIASAVIAHLLDRFFGTGGEIAWLTPGDDSAQSVYANLGFEPVAEQVCYELAK